MKPSRADRGVGLLAAVVVTGMAVMLLAVLTAQLAAISRRSARYAQDVRARALAEAGVEWALANVPRDAKPRGPVRLSLPDGACDVTLTADPNETGCLRVNSEGQLKLAGGVVTCGIEMTLDLKGAPVARWTVSNRKERTEYVRATKAK